MAFIYIAPEDRRSEDDWVYRFGIYIAIAMIPAVMFALPGAWRLAFPLIWPMATLLAVGALDHLQLKYRAAPGSSKETK